MVDIDPIRRFVFWVSERRGDCIHTFPALSPQQPFECVYCSEKTCALDVRLKPLSLPHVVHDRRRFN